MTCTAEPSLGSVLSLHAPTPLTPIELELAQAWLGRTTERLRRRWPQWRIPDDVFVRYLAQRLPGAAPALVELEALRTDDLYLSCGCLLGRRDAIATFDTALRAQVDRGLARVRMQAAERADLVQQLRIGLLVGEVARPAGLNVGLLGSSDYSISGGARVDRSTRSPVHDELGKTGTPHSISGSVSTP